VNVVTDTIRNGVDTNKLFATLDLIKAQPEPLTRVPSATHSAGSRPASRSSRQHRTASPPD
jgi:hypothetical protein